LEYGSIKTRSRGADTDREKRGLVIAAVAVIIVAVYIVRLFTLQLMSDDYKKNADSNAFLKKIDYPSRGVITNCWSITSRPTISWW